MAKIGCCCSKASCAQFWRQIYGIVKRSIPVIIAEFIGWAIFSHVEEGLSVFDCFGNHDRVVEKLYPLMNEQKGIKELFSSLENKTGQYLSVNQSLEIYSIFKQHFNVPDEVILSKEELVYIGCLKWYRFSVMTMTTIGFGSITPVTDTGKMLVVPYALFTIPLMLSLLAYVGEVVSDWTECVILRFHKLIHGEKPLKHRLIKKWLCLFVILWLVCICLLVDLALEIKMKGQSASILWIDGLYGSFVTYTTIGYGDMSYLADGLSFYGYYLIFGLSAVSGLSNVTLELVGTFEFRCHRRQNCCCFQYPENEIEEGQNAVEVEDAPL